MEQVEAGLKILTSAIRNKSGSIVSTSRHVESKHGQIHLSPYIRGRFRLGLAVGVRSLTRPACSNCSRAFDRAEGSIGSEFRS